MKEYLYKPTNLEELSKDISSKLEKKKLSFFQKLIKFFFRR
ncbi:hypothetical protein [Aliarcobacter butzleri]